MLAHDEQHWWYRGRRRVLGAELGLLTIPAGAVLLDAGCGSGRTLDQLSPFGSVAGVDLSPVAVEAARSRGYDDVHVAPVEQLPFEDAAFDVVTCLDVIEHTDDDRVSLAELLRVTRPGGHLVVTVPAYPRLWSKHDEENLHKRRYTRSSLRQAATQAGWDVLRDTYFNALLLAPAAVVRLAQRRREASGQSDLELTPPALNRLLEIPLALEARLIASRRRLPFGLSLMAVMRRAARVSPADRA